MKNPTIATNDFLYSYCNVNHWLGYRMQKNPLDLIAYHNIIYDLRPDLLIETGTWHGASALYFATLMDQLNHGVVFTIDLFEWPMRPRHDRVFYLTGSSVEGEMVEYLREHFIRQMRVMVVLDSDHTKEHVAKELEIYAPMVTLGSYLVVEDTNIHGHPIRNDLPEGPWEAVHEWLPAHPEFEIDPVIEPVFSNNPEGWLRRIK